MSLQPTFFTFGPQLPTRACVTVVIEDDSTDENLEVFDVVLVRLLEADSITTEVTILDNGKDYAPATIIFHLSIIHFI